MFTDENDLVPYEGAWSSVVWDAEDGLTQSRAFATTCTCGTVLSMGWISSKLILALSVGTVLTLVCYPCRKIYVICQDKDGVEAVWLYNHA